MKLLGAPLRDLRWTERVAPGLLPGEMNSEAKSRGLLKAGRQGFAEGAGPFLERPQRPYPSTHLTHLIVRTERVGQT